MSTILKSGARYLCPVCGFLLKHPPQDFNICPSCGVEFDADTVEYSIEELRQAWIDRGMHWTSAVLVRPKEFDPVLQLRRLKPVLSIDNTETPLIIEKKPALSVRNDVGKTFGIARLVYA